MLSSEIESVLLGMFELAPHYQVILDYKQTLDEATVETRGNQGISGAARRGCANSEVAYVTLSRKGR